MDKKEMILAKAETLFAEKGFYGMGLSELLASCGIPKGSFYYYFPDGKIQLIQEVLKYSYGRMANSIRTNILIKETAGESFEYMADRLSMHIEKKHHLGSMLMSMIAIESVYLDEEVNATCRAIYEDWQTLYAQYLLDCGFAGEMVRVKAQAIFALIHGSLISSWIKQDPSDLQLAKAVIREILGSK